MNYAADHPEDDAELARCCAAWLVARESGDAKWIKFALNELRIAAMRAQQAMGVDVSGADGKALIGLFL